MDERKMVVGEDTVVWLSIRRATEGADEAMCGMDIYGYILARCRASMVPYVLTSCAALDLRKYHQSLWTESVQVCRVVRRGKKIQEIVVSGFWVSQ